jgi:hypothetical protein
VHARGVPSSKQREQREARWESVGRQTSGWALRMTAPGAKLVVAWRERPLDGLGRTSTAGNGEDDMGGGILDENLG